MAIISNSSVQRTFSPAKTWTANTIASLGDDGRVAKNGEYGGMFSALSRTKAEKAQNNRVRTQLLQSLGQTFSLSGMGEKDGKVTFSADFMKQLENLLGGALKRSDFKIAADGTVTSGKPLTARRINAIIAKAKAVAAAGISASGGISVDTATGRVKTNFGLRKAAYEPYFDKLETIKRETAKAPEHVKKFFARMETILRFIANEVDVDRFSKSDDDRSFLRNSPAYEWERDLAIANKDKKALDKLTPEFQYFDAKTGKHETLGGTAKWQLNVLSPKTGGGFIHLERAKFVSGKSTDIAPLRKYIADNFRLLATKSIDLYLACKEADAANGNTNNIKAFFDHLEDPGACIEDQGLHLVDFENEHLVDHSNAVSADYAAELEKAADNADYEAAGEAPTGEKLINNEIDFLCYRYQGPDAKKFQDSEDWKDFSATVKARLLPKGEPAPNVSVVKAFQKPSGAYEFKPVMVNGKQLVRPLTAEYIDEIGPACLANATAV